MIDHDIDNKLYNVLLTMAAELSRHTEALKNIQTTQASILEQLKPSRKPKERLSDKTATSTKLKLVTPASGQKNDPSGDPERQASPQQPTP